MACFTYLYYNGRSTNPSLKLSYSGTANGDNRKIYFLLIPNTLTYWFEILSDLSSDSRAQMIRVDVLVH